MPVNCPQCASPNPPKARFCGQCGFPLSAPAAVPPASERRQLTVVFCDLVGSTRLSEKLDPEDFQELIQGYRGICSEVITKLEGHIAQLLGDGVMAYFGFPVAHEDDARRAVEAALNILERAETAHHGAESLRVRVGIHTGLVVVGGGGKEEQLALGEAPNIAARVEAEAEPGQVLISDATFKLVSSHFRLEALPARVLKGLSRETGLYRVIGRTPTGAQEAGEGSGKTPFTGRRKEMETLAHCWELAAAGRQTAHLCGEPGMGKSRLISELKHDVAREAGVVRICRCSPYHSSSALYPIIDLLSRILEFTREESDELKMARMSEWLNNLNLPGAESLSLMASLLNVANPGAPPLELTPQRKRQLTLETLQVVLKARSEQQRLLFVVEDLHWADPSTVELIAAVAANQDHSPIMVLLSYRPEFKPAWPLQSNETILQLHPLDQDEAEAMILRVGQNRALPSGVMAQIRARCEGVPLFVEEVTRAVLESGALRQLEDRYEPEGSLPEHLIPATVRDSLTARMDRLGDAREVLRIASVLGREFDYGMLRAVARTSDGSLQQALARAEDAQLIYRYGTPPESHYVFKHALIQDAAYSSLLKKSRQQYHEHVAHTLLERFPETAEEQPELLAVHYEAAGDSAKAIQYWMQAGKRALERDAKLEAIAQLYAALTALKRLPEGEDTARLELSIQLTVMPAHMAVHGWPSKELERCCLRARELAIQLSDHQSLYGASWGLHSVHFLRGEQDEALVIAKQIFEMGKATGSPTVEISARHAIGFVHFMRTEYRESMEHAEAGLALFNMDRERELCPLFQLSCSGEMLSFRSAIEWLSGRADDARASLNRAIQISRDLKNFPSLACVLGWGMYHHHFWRDVALMRSTALELMPISEEKGFLFWMPQTRMFLGWTQVQFGDDPGGMELFRRGLAEVRASGTRMLLVQEDVMLAEALRKVGRNEEALEALENGIAVAISRGRDVCFAEAYRLRGELRLDAGDEQGALSDFDEALCIAHRQPALSLELRAAVSKAKMFHSQGRREEGLLLVQPIYNQFSQGFNTPDLQDARLLMDLCRETAGRTTGTSH